MYLGVDIGGTTVKFGVVNRRYRIVYTDSLKTDKTLTGRQFADNIINKINEIKKLYKIEKIGVGVAGNTDYKTGFVKACENLPFKCAPVGEWISEGTGLPVTVDNDANCAALGEFLRGDSVNLNNIVTITLGTGIGGGIIINKKIFHGRTGRTGEIGHTTIDMNGEQCSCGKRGCFEVYGSATALKKQTEAAVKENPDSILAEYAKEGITGKTAFDAYYRGGCPVAEKVIDNYVSYLAVGIGDIHNILEPDAIILAGGITKSGDELLEPLKKKLRFTDNVRISTLQSDAGIIGAALLHKR